MMMIFATLSHLPDVTDFVMEYTCRTNLGTKIEPWGPKTGNPSGWLSEQNTGWGLVMKQKRFHPLPAFESVLPFVSGSRSFPRQC